MYDSDDSNFICCIRVAIGSNVTVTKMKCCQCKSGPRRKCRHELGCINVLAEAGTTKLTEDGEMEEKGLESNGLGEAGDGSSGTEYSESDE